MAKKLPFQIGDTVRVNSGVMCPDRPSLSLAGWQGWVTELYPKDGTLEFHWDTLTLRNIPADYIRESEREGLAWHLMVLDFDEVSLVVPRDTLKEAQSAYEEIQGRYAWAYLSDTNPGIEELLGSLGETDEMSYLQAWENHLEDTLQFPFKARRAEAFERSSVAVGAIVEVIGIAEVDDHYGILVNVLLGRRAYVVPLCDFEADDDKSSNYQPLKDYVVWFANR